MKLTALEVKQQKFEKSLRGYDTDEVHAFLNLMSNEWEHLVSRNRELEQQLDTMKEKLKHYERVESALHETLKTAKDSAEEKIEGARREAQSKIEKAEVEADSIVREAQQRRQQIRQSILQLLDRRKEIIGGIQSYLERAQDSLDQFSKDEAKLFEPAPEENHRSKETKRNARRNETAVDDEADQIPGTEDVDDIIDELD